MDSSCIYIYTQPKPMKVALCSCEDGETHAADIEDEAPGAGSPAHKPDFSIHCFSFESVGLKRLLSWQVADVKTK